MWANCLPKSHLVIVFVCPAEPADALGAGAVAALVPSRRDTRIAAAGWEELPYHDAAPWPLARKSFLSVRCFLSQESFLFPTAPELLSCILADTPRRTGPVPVAPRRLQIPNPRE